MTEDLTGRQRAVLEFIAEHIQKSGYPPTIREIGDHLGINSTNGVNDHLKALERKGYLERKDGKSRALKPLRTPEGDPVGESGESPSAGGEGTVGTGRTQRVPLVGRIAAGSPREAIENTDEYLGVGAGLVGRDDDVFALEVTGESMIEDGIYDGDYIFVRPQRDADNGDIVAAMVDGEATVKRFYREEDRVRLQPANEAMEPIYIDGSDGRDPSILGRVVGVFRQF
ncbi:MAG: transcriptional repressor LexA [Bradymonadaceae bacterium]